MGVRELNIMITAVFLVMLINSTIADAATITSNDSIGANYIWGQAEVAA